jgi:hypothetical protein
MLPTRVTKMAAVFGVPDVERIVAFAQRFPVFPCSPTKSPRTSRGFHDASQDPAQIRQWWRQWPDSLVGVPTGQGTGLVVVDYDPDNATQATHTWMAEHSDLLCSTRSHKTGRNGLHYVFRSSDRYQTGTNLVLGGSPRRGLDLRASGGYVIWWPLHGCDVNGGDTIAPLPADLIDERRFNASRDMTPLPTNAPQDWGRERDRVREALTHIQPDGYEHWIRIGMALHHAAGGSDEGFAIWHEWSATGESYDGIEDCRYHWASFGGYSGRALGLGTVYAAAKSSGFDTVPARELPPLEAYADEFGGSPDEPEPKTEQAQTPPIVLRHITDIVAERRESDWLLDDVIEAKVLAVLAGPRGTFKSFVALDWGMRIAESGRAVIILSGEGAGLDRRVDAWHRTHAPGRLLKDFPLYALERALNLNAEQDMLHLRTAIEVLGLPPALVIVDTFSKFSAGLDENDNGEVSTYLASLSLAIREHFGAAVLLVAHSGHGQDNRPRGASALMANPDAEYIINRLPTAMLVTVSRERFKDSPAMPPLAYEAKVIDLQRTDRRGQPVTSLALITTDTPIVAAKPGGANQQRAMVALREFHRAQPAVRFITSLDLADMFKAQGIDRKRRPEVMNWLVNAGVLTPSVGGHTFDPSIL